MSTGICEQCGVPSTRLVIDTIVEDAPIPDDKGQLWADYHAEGPIHELCDEHAIQYPKRVPWKGR